MQRKYSEPLSGRARSGLGWCEEHLKITARRDGFEVIRNGWPDFLLIRGSEALFIEVKAKGEGFHKDQEKILRALEKCGLLVRIAVNGELSNLLTVDQYKVLLQNMGGTKRTQEAPKGRLEARQKVRELIQ